MPKIGCGEGRTDRRDPILDGEVGEWWWFSNEVLEDPPGEAKPSLISEGAGVQGGVSMLGMGWSLKQADS